MTVQTDVRRFIRLPVASAGPVVTTARRIGLVMLAVGLFTLSWERLANIPLGPYNVKLPSLLLSASAVFCAIPVSDVVRRWRSSKVLRAGVSLVALLVAVLLLSAALSSAPGAAVPALAGVLSGAILPAMAVVLGIGTRSSLLWAMRWFTAGAVTASVFGLYQLAAFYLHWPQFVGYSGTGVGSGVGRIAAFNYEPAYFANFLVLALGVAASTALLEGRVLGWAPTLWFAVVLVLTNVRALLFLVPALLILLALRWGMNKRFLARFVIGGAAVLILNLAVTSLVVAIVERPQPAPPPVAAAPAPVAPEPVDSAPVAAPVRPRLQNVLDPNEQSSNAPRLDLYKAVGGVVLQHPLLGVGPGALGSALREQGYLPPNQGEVVVANNVWLQALADGGVLALLLELAVAGGVVVLFFRRASGPVQPMLAAWIAVVGVSGMLTSYFFDIKVWVVLALAVTGVRILRGDAPGLSGPRTPAAR